MGKISTLTITPLGNQSHRNTSSGTKTVPIDAIMWSPAAGKKSYIKIKKYKNNRV